MAPDLSGDQFFVNDYVFDFWKRRAGKNPPRPSNKSFSNFIKLCPSTKDLFVAKGAGRRRWARTRCRGYANSDDGWYSQILNPKYLVSIKFPPSPFPIMTSIITNKKKKKRNAIQICEAHFIHFPNFYSCIIPSLICSSSTKHIQMKNIEEIGMIQSRNESDSNHWSGHYPLPKIWSFFHLQHFGKTYPNEKKVNRFIWFNPVTRSYSISKNVSSSLLQQIQKIDSNNKILSDSNRINAVIWILSAAKLESESPGFPMTELQQTVARLD